MIPKLYNQFICSSLMLPEHREALTEYHVEELQQEEQYKPEVDEQEVEMWEYLIGESLSEGYRVRVTYLSGSERKTITGVVVEAGNSGLRIRDERTDRVKGIDLKTIIAITEG